MRAGKMLKPLLPWNRPGRLLQLRGLWGALGCRLESSLRRGMAVWSWADCGPTPLYWLWLSERLTKPPWNHSGCCVNSKISNEFRLIFFFFAVFPYLWKGKYFSSGNEPAENNSVTPMLRHLIYKIKSTGPITVAEYMKEVLTNPAKVWVGAPGDQAHSSNAVRCEPGGCAQRSPRALSPARSLPGQESGLKTFNSVRSVSPVRLFETSWTAAHQVSLSIINSWSLLTLMSIELMMPSNHLILCRPLLFLPSVFPSIRVFSSESVLCISWPKKWRPWDR